MKKSFIIALHIGYWILYLLMLLLFILFLEAGGMKTMSRDQQHIFGLIKIMSIITIIPAVIGFYIYYTFLFKKYLASKRIAALCIGAFFTSLVAGIAGLLCFSFLQNSKVMFNNNPFGLFMILAFMSLLSLIHGIIALVMKGFISWYADIKVKEELQQKNFETELALVKSQLSPHFLFNTINNIDVLIEKDAGKASAYLNKLSDIMRFMLYETKPANIPLQKELEYIGKYIELQKIRNSNDNFVQYTTTGVMEKWEIAPMLFIPFIENAFKHSGNKKKDNAIIIRFAASEESLDFFCENHFSGNILNEQEAGGLGNDLIQKRLNLLYPGKHELKVENRDGIYKVQLIISADALSKKKYEFKIASNEN